jgi:hypothetical protein
MVHRTMAFLHPVASSAYLPSAKPAMKIASADSDIE